MTHRIEYVGFDDLALPALEGAALKSQIARDAERLHADGSLKVHLAKHQHPNAKPNYEIHLFFNHAGHKHTSDKHHSWDALQAVREAFSALETQIDKERTKRERTMKNENSL